MGIERVGYRRVYCAYGCSVGENAEYSGHVSLGDVHVDVYIGPNPQWGIAVADSGRYLLPLGELQPMVHVQFFEDAADADVDWHCFTELICWREVPFSDDVSISHRNKEEGSERPLLEGAEKHRPECEMAADLVAGAIALRFHPQFVKEVMNENAIALRPEDRPAISWASPSLEVLEKVSLAPAAIPHVPIPMMT